MSAIFRSGDDESRSDSMSVLPYSDGMLEFMIDSPWYGSSETGFGADLEYTITREEAIRLRDALTKWIEASTA
jgi:hypothetical protein